MSPESNISDTSKKAAKILAEGYRRMSPEQKMACVRNMTNTILQMALARIRKNHGNISEREQRLRLASLWLDRDVMIKVFNWDPDREGY